MLLGDEKILGLLELSVRLVPGVFEALVEAGDGEVLDRIVEPRDLAFVALVPQKVPGALLRLHLVAAVQDRVEPPVVGDPVLLAVVLASLDHELVQVLEVRDQLRVPGLDEAAGGEVLDPADVRPEQVRLQTGANLRQRVSLVRHVGELRLVLRMCLHVRGEHGLAAVVFVTGPVEHLQSTALFQQLRPRRVGDARPSGEEPRASYCRRNPEEVFTAETPLQRIVSFGHPDRLLPWQAPRTIRSPSPGSRQATSVPAVVTATDTSCSSPAATSTRSSCDFRQAA